MKKIVFMLIGIALFATSGLAAPAIEKKKQTEKKNYIYNQKKMKVQALSFVAGTSCTVSASWKNEDGKKSSIELTFNCEDCTTTQQACDKAYKLLSILIPG